MCIRDRHGTAIKIVGMRRSIFAHRPASLGPMPSPAPMLCSCLLYTSDAADERSSVDLGGRRIIKKKKQGAVGETRVNTKTKRQEDYRQAQDMDDRDKRGHRR